MSAQVNSTASGGLVFNNTYSANCSQQYIACVLTAEANLQSLWTNPVTINVSFDEQSAGNNGFLAENSFYFATAGYSQLRSVLPASDALPTGDPTGGVNWSLPVAYARMLGLSDATNAADDTVT